MALTYLETQAQILLRLGDADLTLIQDFILETVAADPGVFEDITLGTTSSSGDIFGLYADGASAVAIAIVSPAYTTSGAKILSVKNDSTEKASIDKDGKLTLAAGVVTTSVTSTGAATLGTTSTTGQITGLYSDGASAVAVTVSSPSYSNASAKLLSVKNNSTEKFSIQKDGNVTAAGSVTAATAAIPGTVTLGSTSVTGQLTGLYSDGASAVAVTVSSPAYSDASAKLLSVKNDTTEKFSIQKDGNVTASGTLAASNLSGTNTGDVTLATVGSSPAAAGASLSGQVLTLQPADGSNGGVVSTTTQTFAGAKTFSSTLASSVASGSNAFTLLRGAKIADSDDNTLTVGQFNWTMSTSLIAAGTQFGSATGLINTTGNAPLKLAGNTTDGASAIGVTTNTLNAFSTSGAKLLSVQNNSVEKAFFDKDGNLELLTTPGFIVMKSPDGTRYKLSIANGGTVSITAA